MHGEPGRSERWAHLFVLLLIAGMLAAAVALRPATPGDERVYLGGFLLPEVCTLKTQFGVRCPGCGLTRSWISAAHGSWAHSWAHHRLGLLTLTYALLQALRHGLWLALPGWRAGLATPGRWLDRGLLLLALLLFLAWLPNLAADLRAG